MSDKKDDYLKCPDCGRKMVIYFQNPVCDYCEEQMKRKAAECKDCSCDGTCDEDDDCCKDKKDKTTPKKDGCGGCKGGC